MPNSPQDQLLRRETIRQLLLQAPASTQRQLVDELNERGHVATQSSVSRDLKELGAIKTAQGYELPRADSAPHDELDGVAAVEVEAVDWISGGPALATTPDDSTLSSSFKNGDTDLIQLPQLIVVLNL